MTRRAFRLPTLLALSSMLLAACADMTALPPGTPQAQIVARFGPPTSACPTPHGGQQLIWSTQPHGQHAWLTHVDAQGLADSPVPALTDARFQQLAQGDWSRRDVGCAFGPPAEISEVGRPSTRQTVWSYRYRQQGVWNSLMHVYFDREQDRVTRFHPGPDPAFEREWEFLRD